MPKSKSPFKHNAALLHEIEGFLRRSGVIFAQHAKRTSTFFELAAYNDLVRFYERNGYEVQPRNLFGANREFRYALSPNTRPDRCSFFAATRRYANGAVWQFEIRHNLRIQSVHDTDVFFTPDYAVVMAESLQTKRLAFYYNGKADYWFVEARSVQTFAEAKHYNPSPEMVLNFVGLVNEVIPDALTRSISDRPPKHCAPSIIISGVGSPHVQKIKNSLEKRYQLNVFLGLFARPNQIHSVSGQSSICKIGTR